MKDLIQTTKNNLFIFCLISFIFNPEAILDYQPNLSSFKTEVVLNELTNTIYASNGQPLMQFKYKNEGMKYVTECSVPDWVKIIDFTSTTHKHLEIFAPACLAHDLNYRAPWRIAGFIENEGKQYSDKRFHTDMIRICEDRHDNFIGEQYCKVVAAVWYTSVKNFGENAFEKGQVVAGRDCEKSSVVGNVLC